MRHTTVLFAGLLGLLLAIACEARSPQPGRTVDAGYAALNTGSHVEALENFELALGVIGPQDERFEEAKMGQLRALCHVDAAEATAEFLSVAEFATLRAQDYSLFVSELVSVASRLAATASGTASEPNRIPPEIEAAGIVIGHAIEILQAGKRAFPDDEKWDALIQKTGDRVRALDHPDALEAFRGLGYTGPEASGS